jgi:hypothetical protein
MGRDSFSAELSNVESQIVKFTPAGLIDNTATCRESVMQTCSPHLQCKILIRLSSLFFCVGLPETAESSRLVRFNFLSLVVDDNSDCKPQYRSAIAIPGI